MSYVFNNHVYKPSLLWPQLHGDLNPSTVIMQLSVVPWFQYISKLLIFLVVPWLTCFDFEQG